MLPNHPTDEQIAAQEERNAARDAQVARKGVAMLASCSLLIAAIVSLALAVRANLIPEAAQLGHILAVVELAALLIASTYRPQWVLASLPLTIATVVALPCAYFIYLEWRSNRE